jgi:hypothetical protein
VILENYDNYDASRVLMLTGKRTTPGARARPGSIALLLEKEHINYQQSMIRSILFLLCSNLVYNASTKTNHLLKS